MTNVNELLRRVLSEAEWYSDLYWQRTSAASVPKAENPIFKEAHDYLDSLEGSKQDNAGDAESLAAFKDFDASIHVVPMTRLTRLEGVVQRLIEGIQPYRIGPSDSFFRSLLQELHDLKEAE